MNIAAISQKSSHSRRPKPPLAQNQHHEEQVGQRPNVYAMSLYVTRGENWQQNPLTATPIPV